MARGPGSGLHREAIKRTDERVCETLRVADDCPFFEGHFDKFPIFPAVAQLQVLVVDLARETFSDLQGLIEARRVKFLRPIRPGDQLQLSLTRKGSNIAYSLLVDGQPASNGTLEFRS